MTIRHLSYFIKVSELGSISKAAEELCVAQPSVSQTIKELENYYGITLFIRSNRKLTLTKEGEELLAKARNTVESFNSFEDLANEKKNNPHIRIGCTVTYGIRALPLLIKEIKKAIPNITYNIYMDKLYILEDKLIKGELDFALVEGLPTNKNLKSMIFGHDKMWVVAGKEYNIPNKISLKDLHKYDLLVREEDSSPRKLTDYYLALKGIKYTPKMESISNVAIMRMVQANEGVAFLPMGVCEPYIEKGLVRKIETDIEVKRPLHVLYNKNKQFSNAGKKAINIAFKFLTNYRDDD